MVNRPTLQSVSVIASWTRTQQQRGSTDVVISPTGTIREMVKMTLFKFGLDLQNEQYWIDKVIAESIARSYYKCMWKFYQELDFKCN